MGKKVVRAIVPVSPGKQLFNFPSRSKYIFLALVGFIFYANTLFNEYAFDDRGVILDNTYVQMGFKGIPKILTHDSWASYYTYLGGDASSRQLTGGRYRPFSEIIFAIEKQLMGKTTMLPYFRHLVNVLAYMACTIAIFCFLDNFLFKKMFGGSDVAFLATLLFAIHPIHTEVVANIKSLDEILSLLFIMLTFIYSLRYIESKQIKHLLIGIVSYLFALLSKEYAITLLFFIPFLFYLLQNRKPVSALIASAPYYGVFAAYLLLRYNAVGFYQSHLQSTDPLSNPYFFATPMQKIATEWFVLGKYITLLAFPYPLSYDYSYSQIPLHNFSDITVILSPLIYISIFIWGIRSAKKKNVISFALFFFLVNIFMVSNFVLDIGAAMGERLVFHSSLGFVTILSWYLLNVLIPKIPGTFHIPLKAKKRIIIGVLTVISIVCFGETVMRNTQWKDDTALYIHDVKVSPNSCLANDNAGWSYLGIAQRKDSSPAQSKTYLDSAHKYLLRALYLDPKFYIACNNLGDVCFLQDMLDSANYYYDMVKKLYPGYPELKSDYSQLYFTKGLHLAMRNRKPREAIGYMKKALSIDSTNADIWYNLGIAYHQVEQYDSARYAFAKTLLCNPDSMDATNAKKDLLDLSN